MEVVVYANYIGHRRFYRYVVNTGRWSPYVGGQLDRFHCSIRADFKNSGDLAVTEQERQSLHLSVQEYEHSNE